MSQRRGVAGVSKGEGEGRRACCGRPGEKAKQDGAGV